MTIQNPHSGYRALLLAECEEIRALRLRAEKAEAEARANTGDAAAAHTLIVENCDLQAQVRALRGALAIAELSRDSFKASAEWMAKQKEEAERERDKQRRAYRSRLAWHITANRANRRERRKAEAERDLAIREIGEWARKAGLIEAQRDKLREALAELLRLYEGIHAAFGCSEYQTKAEIEAERAAREALKEPTP